MLFVILHSLFMTNDSTTRVSAVVAAYKERPRIGSVLETLIQTPCISEVIVVDDGSSDGTAEFVKEKFPSVRLLVNEHNRGKAYSMDRGVKESTGDVIFFCDADLVGLTPEMVLDIVEPVLEKKYDMFIGIRNNVMQKSFLPFALNSGERAMRKEVWQRLPQFYKYRFRIEAGLNFMVYFMGSLGMGYKVMSYYQTLKEKKYGFWRGEWQRQKMNFDVVIGWVRAFFEFFVLAKIFNKKL